MTSFANRSRSSSWTSRGGPQRRGAHHPVDARIALFNGLQLLDDVGGRTGQEAAGLHRVFDALRDVKLEAQRKPLAELELDAAARIGGPEADHVPLDGAALGRAAADDAADAVLGHEVEGPLRAALDRLPAFDR